MNKRTPKNDDQSQIDKAFEIIKEIIRANSGVEGAILFCAMMSAGVDNYIHSGITYKEWCCELDRMKKHYKHWWSKEFQESLNDN